MKACLLKVIVIGCAAASLAGCAVIFADVGALRNIKAAHAKVFDKDLASCYDLTTAAFPRWQAIIFQKRYGDYIVGMEFDNFFRNCVDTTEVGIFFTAVASDKTEVKVTSPDYRLSEFVSRKLFEYIEKDGNVPPEEITPAPSTYHARFKY